jgi:hypothetical protein
MGMRAFVVGFLWLLGGCEYGYIVERRMDGIGHFDLVLLEKAVRVQPGVFEVLPWNGTQLLAVFRRGAAHVSLFYEVEKEFAGLRVGSDWWGLPPDYAVLCASTALQDEIVRTLHLTVPGFPAAAEMPLAWSGLDNPRGAQFAELKARYEAEFGK